VNGVEGFIYEFSRAKSMALEQNRRNFCVDKEALWRLKSRDFYLVKGDENTNFFFRNLQIIGKT
jgi:hypothetical protein